MVLVSLFCIIGLNGRKIMELVEIIYVSVIFALGLFLTVGGCILQRDKYWRRVWRELGEPQVESVKELMALRAKRQRASP